MKFHARHSPERPLPLPLMFGHFVPWYTIHGKNFPLPPEDARDLAFQPDPGELRHWHDTRAGYWRTHLHIPAIGLYDSRSPAVIEWQIETAQFYGLSGFILNWYGKHSVENIVTLHLLRGIAKWNEVNTDRRFHYFISLDSQMQQATEGKQPVTLEEDLAYIRDHLLRDDYLCRDGKPVFSIFPYENNCPAWRAAANAVFGKDGVDLIWINGARPEAEACYAWVQPDRATLNPQSPYTWNDPDNAGDGWLREFYRNANDTEAHAQYLMAGVWPGFNDQLVRWAWNPGQPDIRPRVICRETTRGNTLDLTWAAYLDYLKKWAAGENGATVPAPLIQLVTWNDYAEATIVEPTRDFGTAPLSACRKHLDEARLIWNTAVSPA